MAAYAGIKGSPEQDCSHEAESVIRATLQNGLEQYKSMLGDKHRAVYYVSMYHGERPRTDIHTLCIKFTLKHILSQSHTFHIVHNLCVKFILNCMLET